MSATVWLIQKRDGTFEQRYIDPPELPHTGDFVVLDEGESVSHYRVEGVLHQWSPIPSEVMPRSAWCDMLLGVKKSPIVYVTEIAHSEMSEHLWKWLDESSSKE